MTDQPVTYDRSGPLLIGVDVGSTTVKAVVLDPDTMEIIWSDYQRHNTKQPEKTLELLEAIEAAFPLSLRGSWRVFMTGSGSGPLCKPTGAKFVQEVNAVTLAVERLHPDVMSVIELGGQDAKIIMFTCAKLPNGEDGEKIAVPSMNDKCASGTGATIDKCMIKAGMPIEEVGKLHFDDTKLHHVAAKCGVFAETDIVNLVKSGIPACEVLCSLADAIVLQNLSVLTRGNTLKHKVLLLGGPNTYLPFLQECWRKRIPETWEERGYDYPKDIPIEELIFVPDNAEYYAAFGACAFGLYEADNVGVYQGTAGLREYMDSGRKERLAETAGPPLVESPEEIDEFRELYKVPEFTPLALEKGQTVRCVIGLDGGSTSSKAVLIDEDGEIVAKAYQLSGGNPIQDSKELLAQLKKHVEDQGATLEIFGMGATGYAADVLEKAMKVDVNIVETVAHMMSAVKYCGDVDVVCDIGGQDIKVLFLKNGEIQNFRLSNSCSAGNGMLLQAMADQFGLPVQDYAKTAFQAELAPKFSYGCAVFLDTDRVNFQKEGFSKEELLAGLAQVLPKNIWQYVVQIPRMASLGKRFVLQGGTQYNLAAVKAQVDYIKERVPGAEIFVHPHTGEAGALGAAFEALRVVKRKGSSTFIGIDAGIDIKFVSKNDEETVCHFCPNLCKRTFIDTTCPDGSTARYISGFSCEKGTVESEEALKELLTERRAIAKEFPNIITYEANLAFKHFYEHAKMPAVGAPVEDVVVKKGLFSRKRVKITRAFVRTTGERAERRKTVRIGMPRVMNMYSTAPYFRTYFETLGVRRGNIVFSDQTTEEMWVEGGKYGSIDPCFPSKVCQAHIHNLLFHHHEKKALNYIFFPILTKVPTFVENILDSVSCPIVAGVPEVMKAAFTKEVDFFAERNIEYIDTGLSYTEPNLMALRMFETWGERLGVTQDESDFAHNEGLKALEAFELDLQEKGRAILDTVESEDRIALLVVGRPYHSDPGLNHGIPEEYQLLGYPVLSVRSLPRDPEYMSRYFAAHENPMDINDVWPENYSANSAQKIWAVRYATHHPNIALLDLSSFKCGHDAPTYGMVDSMVIAANIPYAAQHDLDANKPTGSIKIRVKTYSHTLKMREEALEDVGGQNRELNQSIEVKHLELLKAKQRQMLARKTTDPELEEKINALAEKVRSYAPPERAPEPDPGLLTLMRKTDRGLRPAAEPRIFQPSTLKPSPSTQRDDSSHDAVQPAPPAE
jgi:activator of 2-hydroxyglutaryl-CoA dehydratase/predicted nucleotide-binding protein (sugar kinase/HSP70/actin superfamily)